MFANLHVHFLQYLHQSFCIFIYVPPTAVFDVFESVIKEDMELKTNIFAQVPLWPVLVQSGENKEAKESLVKLKSH